MRTTDVLMYVEDPGAANYVAPLPVALAERGWRVTLVADEAAQMHLRQRGITVESVPDGVGAEELLRACAPRVLVVGTSENPDTIGLSLIGQGRAQGIETVGIVDGPASAAHRFRGRRAHPLAHAPDWLVVVDERTKADYVALGFPAARAIVCGHPQYDYLRTLRRKLVSEPRLAVRRRLLPHVPPDRAMIVFLAEVSTGLDAKEYQRSPDYTLTGRGAQHERTAVVFEEVLDALEVIQPRPYVVLRLHPKNAVEDFAPYRGACDAVSAGGQPYELVYAADLVVGMTTMLLVEAALLGCSVLSVVPRAVERAWLPQLADDLVLCVTTRGALRRALAERLGHALVKRPATSPDPGEPSAVSRVVDLLAALLAGSQRRQREAMAGWSR